MSTRKASNPFLAGTDYVTMPVTKKPCRERGSNILAEQGNQEDTLVDQTALRGQNIFDSRLHSLVASCDGADKMTYTEILNGMMSKPDDWQDLGFSALSSRFIHNPHDRAAISLCLHSAHLTQVKLSAMEQQIQELKSARTVKSTTVVQDQYELVISASRLPEEQLVVLLPRPFRSVNIRAAVRSVISRRRPKTKNRSIMMEMNSALTHCVRQAITQGDTRKFYYGNKTMGPDYTLFDPAYATSITVALSSFVSINPFAATDGYTAPPPDLDQFRGIALSLLTDVFGDGPNRRTKRPRYDYMDVHAYAAHLNADSINYQRIQEMERRLFGQVSVEFPVHVVASVDSPPAPTPSPPSFLSLSPMVFVKPKPENL